MHKTRSYDAWSTEETRRLVQLAYGKQNCSAINQGIRSISDKIWYAQFHVLEAKKIERRVIRKTHSIFTLDIDNPSFNIDIREIGAHITAGLQATHSLADITAGFVYHAPQLENITGKLQLSEIDYRTIANLINKDSKLQDIKNDYLEISNGNFKHLNAATNLIKHQTIVLPYLNEDFTGQAKKFSLKLSEFSYRGQEYPSVDAIEFIEGERKRVSQCCINLGNSINEMISQTI